MISQSMKPGIPGAPICAKGRGRARGVLFFLLLSACTSSGGGAVIPQAAPALTPAGPSTKQMTVMHGQGFLCWVSDDGAQLWCWASETNLATTPFAVAMGLTATPQLIVNYVGPSLLPTRIQMDLSDHAICWGNIEPGCLAGTTMGAGGSSFTYTETVTATVTGTNSVTFPEDNKDLTFVGLVTTFADADIPWKAHSPTYKHVRRTV